MISNTETYNILKLVTSKKNKHYYTAKFHEQQLDKNIYFPMHMAISSYLHLKLQDITNSKTTVGLNTSRYWILSLVCNYAPLSVNNNQKSFYPVSKLLEIATICLSDHNLPS